ncbi:MAG: ABC transporter substrate-binding protein [Armatimonadota bacterium]|nr:MAG: ABC transporter substrate-binding protein [Armatimonadota bacterium]
MNARRTERCARLSLRGRARGQVPVWLPALIGLAAVAAVLLWMGLAAVGGPAGQSNDGRIEITYWARHTGHEYEADRALAEEYNRSQDRVRVRPLPIGYNLEKIVTGIVTGTPPDVMTISDDMLLELAWQGAFMPLEELLAERGIRQQDYFASCWRAGHVNGRLYALAVTSDSYLLLYNKGAFREAGLDPERPPRTLAELDDYADRLTKYGPNGEIERMGFVPWIMWDHSTMYGWLFGGEWYDAASRRVTPTHPAILRSFEWQRKYARKYDINKIMSFQQGFGSYFSAMSPFYAGKVAMIVEGEWQVTFTKKYAPKLDWGATPVPPPPGGRIASSGGMVLFAIPVGSRRPEAAADYIAWYHTARRRGTTPLSDFNYAIHNIPTRREAAAEQRFMGDPKFRPFVELFLNDQVHNNPPLPNIMLYTDEIDVAREQIIRFQKEPLDAMRDVQAKVQRELDRALTYLRNPLR